MSGNDPVAIIHKIDKLEREYQDAVAECARAADAVIAAYRRLYVNQAETIAIKDEIQTLKETHDKNRQTSIETYEKLRGERNKFNAIV